MTPLRDRPTADLIVIVLTSIVAIIMLISLAGIFLLEIFRPDTDITGLTQRIGTLTSTLIGVIVGYVAGKTQSNGRRENGTGER